MSINKLILRCLKQSKWLFVCSTLLVIAEGLSYLATVGLQKWLVDDVLLQGQYHKLPMVISLFVVAFVSFAWLFTAAPYMAHKHNIEIRLALQQRMLLSLQKVSLGTYRQHPTTHYLHRLTNDIPLASNSLAIELPNGLQQMMMALALTYILGRVSPILLLLVFLLSATYFLVSKNLGPKFKAISHQVQESKSALSVHVEEGISSTREVVAYHRRDWELGIYHGLFNRYFEMVMKETKFQNKLWFLSEPLKWGANLAVLGYGAYQVIEGKISLGLFVVMYQFTWQLVSCYQKVFDFVISFHSRRALFERIKDVLDLDWTADGAYRLEGPIRSIELARVCFAYGDDSKTVLQDLSLDLPVGSKVAIVGSSGCGKSTIAQLLMRLYEPTAGRLLVNGMGLTQIRKTDWLARVAIVQQEPYFFPDTIRSNLLLGLESVSDQQLRAACQIAGIDEVITQLPQGYDTVIEERGISLSGGQRQRLAIARAILKDPDILVLDEATSALDTRTERLVQCALDEQRQGRTTIIIAHRLSTIQNAHLIYVLENGRLVEQGTHDELMQQHTTYKKLFTAQITG